MICRDISIRSTSAARKAATSSRGISPYATAGPALTSPVPALSTRVPGLRITQSSAEEARYTSACFFHPHVILESSGGACTACSFRKCRHQQEATDPGKHGGLNSGLQALAINGVGQLNACAASPGGENHDIAACHRSGQTRSVQLGEVAEQWYGASRFDCRRLFFFSVQCDHFMTAAAKVFRRRWPTFPAAPMTKTFDMKSSSGGSCADAQHYRRIQPC